MGVLVLCVAILPFLGVGGMQIYRAEMPGPSKDRLTPRIARTAKLLWGVYVAAQRRSRPSCCDVGGMSWFDAVCHTFATLSTGGFSTRTASVAAYDSLYIETGHHRLHVPGRRQLRPALPRPHRRAAALLHGPGVPLLLRRPGRAASLLVTLNIWRTSCPTPAARRPRQAAFQCTSIMTTTGFCTADFDRWPDASRMVLMILMFIGGCAGSTGGGIKMVRVFVLFKTMLREIRTYMQPNAVLRVKLGRKPLEPSIISNISAFFVIFVRSSAWPRSS